MTESASFPNDQKPASARIYDYMLGGEHNTAADRRLGDQLDSVAPFKRMALLNRAFLRTAVAFLVDAGIRQFLDLGSGIPTSGNVHEIAQAADPTCRVCYVDNDPVAIALSRQLLVDDERATIVSGDLRDPEKILAAPEIRGLLDFREPIGLLFLGVVQYLPDSDDPAGVLARYLAAVPAGSHLAMTHFTQDNMEAEMAAAVEFFRHTTAPMTPRRHAEVGALVAGLELVEPGVVFTARWRPPPEYADGDPDRCGHYAVIGRKR